MSGKVEMMVFERAEREDGPVIESIDLAMALVRPERDGRHVKTASDISRVVRRGLLEKDISDIGETRAVSTLDLQGRLDVSRNYSSNLAIELEEAYEVAEIVEKAQAIVDEKSSASQRYLNIPAKAFEPALRALEMGIDQSPEGQLIELDDYRQKPTPAENMATQAA